MINKINASNSMAFTSAFLLNACGDAKLIEDNRANTPNDPNRIIPQRRSAYKMGAS